MKTKTRVAALLAALMLGACASRPDDIAAAYVSPLPYQQLDCQQLAAEAQRVSASAAVAAGAQNQQASNDAVATTIAVVVFWPALFLIKGDNAKAAEVARLKGEMQAVEQASIAKHCDISFKGGPAATAAGAPKPAPPQAKVVPTPPQSSALPASPATAVKPSAQPVAKEPASAAAAPQN
ncbi:hypothetical protein [Kaistia algarum]|uniref:hypothetical protein n=1 Tax=Kaistia algarum TaxID=2083279 RepID=UPI002251CFA8|nr:hypothetical protein [Kaistia algarum]MCX5512139.1 hypothetical protein [Kaistia algarum]